MLVACFLLLVSQSKIYPLNSKITVPASDLFVNQYKFAVLMVKLQGFQRRKMTERIIPVVSTEEKRLSVLAQWFPPKEND
jgi:hypothetical protein